MDSCGWSFYTKLVSIDPVLNWLIVMILAGLRQTFAHPNGQNKIQYIYIYIMT